MNPRQFFSAVLVCGGAVLMLAGCDGPLQPDADRAPVVPAENATASGQLLVAKSIDSETTPASTPPTSAPLALIRPGKPFSEFEDVTLTEADGRLVFANANLKLQFDLTSGAWQSLATTAAPDDNMIQPDMPFEAVDFRIDDVWMMERHGAVFTKYEVTTDAAAKSVSLRLTYGMLPRPVPILVDERWRGRTPTPPPVVSKIPPPNYEYELTTSYTLFAGERRLARSATLVRNLSKNLLSSSFRRMEGFLFILPGAVIGDPAECTVEIPGPLYTYSYQRPGTPYTSISGMFFDCNTAPDRIPGLVAIDNRSRKLTLATWLDTRAEVDYIPYLSGDGKRISILFCDLRAVRLADAARVESDTQSIELVDTFPEAQARYRDMLARSMPIAQDTPDWVRDMIILEVMPSFFPDGIRGLTKRLPFYREIGFNTIYLMPHWLGSYANIDPYTMDPKLGKPEDIQEMVRAAHALGMRVLFDMVIHGMHPDSPVVKEHPEFFTHNDVGLPVLHHGWGSMNTDPSNAGYQQYMADLVKHDVRTYDIDGYRVDANTFKMPNWDPHYPQPAWRGGNTLPLYRRMYDAMREEKPDAILLSEIFGPVWHSVCNVVHEANWPVVTDLLPRMDSGEVTAAHYKAGMASHLATLPPGANRVRFARNHDTSWFHKFFHGYTPRFLGVDAIHGLFGIPEVFAGDPGAPPSPDDDPATWEHYRHVFAVRKTMPEFIHGEVLLEAVTCDNEHVFSGLRRLDGQTSLALVSLSEREETVVFTLADDEDGTARTLPAALVDIKTDAQVAIAPVPDRPGTGTIKLAPFQIVVGRLSAARGVK